MWICSKTVVGLKWTPTDLTTGEAGLVEAVRAATGGNQGGMISSFSLPQHQHYVNPSDWFDLGYTARQMPTVQVISFQQWHEVLYRRDCCSGA